MCEILLSIDINDILFVASIVAAVINILLIIKFFELVKDVKDVKQMRPTLDFLCGYLQTQFSSLESQSSYIPTEDNFKDVIIGSWESDNENYVLSSDRTYEKNVHFSSWDKEENSTTKGTWKIEGYNITLSPTESTNKELIKETYMVICLTMSKIVLKNNENNSKITLNRT